MNRFSIAIIIAIVGMVCFGLGVLLSYMGAESVAEVLGYGGIIIGLISYIFAGFVTAIKVALKIGMWGFIILPLPFSLMSGALSIFFALVAFIFLPIIPILMARSQYAA